MSDYNNNYGDWQPYDNQQHEEQPPEDGQQNNYNGGYRQYDSRPSYENQPPYGSRQNDFYGGTPPYGFQNIVPHEKWNSERRILRRMSMAAAAGILLYIVFSGIFSAVLQYATLMMSMSDTFDYEAFRTIWNSADMQSLISMLYSILFVGGAFFIVYLCTRNRGIRYNFPMGKPRHAKYLPVIILAGLGICLVGNIVTSYLDMILEALFGVEITSSTQTVSQEPGGIFLIFLSTAVVPALVEEVALRGIVMQPLRRYGDWFAILCSAMIFALMHCNLVQIPFAFIAGVVIGYAVITTESIWTGVLIHFANNAFSVIVSLVADKYGYSSAQYAACNIAFYALIIIGIACAFIYVRLIHNEPLKKYPFINKSRNMIAPHPYYSAVISNGSLFKTYVLTVPMIIALLAVAYETTLALIY